MMASHLDYNDTMESQRPLLYGLVLLLVVAILYVVIDSWKAGLSYIPGPFLARYTDAWNLWSIWRSVQRGDRVEHSQRLQTEYGDVVRVGPRSVLVLDPAAVPVIYGVRAKLDKGPAYIPFRQPGVKLSLLSIPDERTHSQYRKLVSNAYSLSSIKAYEPYVEELVERFIEVCDEHAQTREPLNLSLWCHYYCFDVVSKVTLGHALGFMNGKGQDTFSLVKRVKAFGWYAAIVSQMPWLHKIFVDNPLMRKTKPSAFIEAVRGTVNERLDALKVDPEAPRPDLLAHFVAAHKTQPLMDRKQVMVFAQGNLVAGGLSPGTAFGILCQYLATHPDAQEKLHAEVMQAHCTKLPAFDDVKDLPYLEGVIREAYRMTGNASFSLQRITPDGGLILPDGSRIPAGIKIGCPPEAISKDPRIWGPDAEVYRPERWVQAGDESDEAYQERRKLYEKTDLTFGQGSRTCIGKSITALEFFKVVASLMMLFKFELSGKATKREVFVRVVKR